MDQMDEFEIKPLTEGLGFHKKSKSLSQQVKDSGVLEDKSRKPPTAAPTEASARPLPKMQFEDILKALETPKVQKSSDVKLTQPLPSVLSTEIEMPKAPHFPNPFPTPAPIPSVQKNRQTPTPLNKVVENVGLRRGASDSPMRMLERTPMSLASALLDAAVILANTLVFLVALMSVTKIDLASLVMKSGLDLPMRVSFGVLFFSVMLMYVVISRSFFGRTLGEWTFDLQMGDDAQRHRALYPLQVLFRTMIVVLTGVVTLPLLSWAFGKDLLAPLTGIQLYRSR